MHNRKICLALVCATSMTFSLFAIPKKVQADPRLDSVKAKYSEVLGKVEAANEEVRKIDAQLIDLTEKQRITNEGISNKEAEIANTENKIALKKEELKKSEDSFKKRVRAVYKNGNDATLDVMLNADSLGDLIDRGQTIRNVSKHEKKVINRVITDREKLEEEKVVMVGEVEKLATLRDELNVQAAEINTKKSEVDQKAAEVNAVKNQYAAEIKEIEDSIAAAIAAQRAAQEAASRPSGGQNPGFIPDRGNATANAVLAEAHKYLGVPYVWGGSTPAGFDCSGFTQYVFRKVGIEISRTTYTQVNKGIDIPLGQQQPGDLVFMGDRNSPYHVGIYAGGGMYIHAPQTGDVVKYSPMSGVVTRIKRVL